MSCRSIRLLESTVPAKTRVIGELVLVAFTVLAGSLTSSLVTCSVAFAQLPNESELPDTPNSPGALAPTEETLPNTAPLVQLPGVQAGEEKLPAGSGASPAKSEAGINEIGSDEDRGELRPILRLAFDGHTGPIRTMTISGDGQWMASAGEDKDVHIWSPQASTPTGWFHRRTIRWQVNRSQRGRIYAISSHGSPARGNPAEGNLAHQENLASPHNEVAFAGYGAMGGNGEIWIADAISGNLKQTLVDDTNGHRQVVLSLAWAPDGSSRLVSADIEGKVILWEKDETSGQWSHRTLVDVDRQTYGDDVAEKLKTFRTFVPITWLGSDSIIVPWLTGAIAEPVATVPPAVPAMVPLWSLARFSAPNFSGTVFAQPEIIGSAVTLTSSVDGKKLVVSDQYGAPKLIRVADNGTASSVETFSSTRKVFSAAMDATGNHIYVGTFTGVDDKGIATEPRIESWDISASPAKELSATNVTNLVRGICTSNDPRQVIAAMDTRLEVFAVDDQFKVSPQSRGRLDVAASPAIDVRFRNVENSYEIGIATDRDQDGNVVFRDLFDLKEVRLLAQANEASEAFISRQRLANKWTAEVFSVMEGEGQGKFSRLIEGDQKRGVLPLVEIKDGFPTAIATLAVPNDGQTPSSNPTPSNNAVIVGTNGENNIYVYRADESDPPKLLRQFRGHAGAVRALSTSSDGRYLASCSDDATIAVWKLEDLFTASENENRWGVDFEVQNNRLIASSVRDDGPLYFRGIRGGDQLIGIKWVDADGKEVISQSDAAMMLESLRTLRFDTQVAFDFTRFGRPLPGFQSYAAWQPIATLFVDTNREWAFWTPAGYYNASINGHQHFGWQINRGVRNLPDYYRAAQFRDKLERPAVMQRLLEQGSLDRAMRATVGAIGPPPGDEAIVNQINNKPLIEIVSPAAGETLIGDQVDVIAKIRVPLGATLAPPKAFVSGVPAVDRVMVSDMEVTSDDSTGMRELTYRWTMRLPSEPLLKLEVIAATEAAAVDRVVADFAHQFKTPDLSPRLHVLAIGVSDYRDRQIQSLDFAARATDVVANLFRASSSPLYRVTSDQLIDRDATRPLWRVFANQAADDLAKTVSPNDLVVMYLCGHGLRDRLTGQWYFVTSDARYNDLMNDRYDDCLSFSDLGALSSLPCRKLAILDSCHSGAVQPLMRSDDLKSALRFLQDDVVLTMTASEGDEEAAEQRETKLGRFTTELVAALSGDADRQGNADGIVTLRETIDFVTRRVSEESEKEGAPQHPTASPEYLLETLELPLATVK